jgi:hypothetical protein
MAPLRIKCDKWTKSWRYLSIQWFQWSMSNILFHSHSDATPETC